MSSCFSPSKPKQMQGSKRPLNDAEEGTMLNPLIEIPYAPKEQPTAQGLVEKAHDLDDCNFLENHPKRRWTKRFINHSSDKEIVHEEPNLSMPKPPSRSDGFSMEKEHLEALKMVSLALIFDIRKATNAKKMIDLSSKAFTYFDSLGVDYARVYQAVCSVIHHQHDKEAIEKQKLQAAFDAKVSYDQATSEFSKAQERYTVAARELEDHQHELDAIKGRLKGLYQEIKKAEEVKVKLQAKVSAGRGVKVSCEKACSKANSKVEKTALEMSEAQKAIDAYEWRLKEHRDGLNRALEELWSLRASLQ